MSSETQRSVHIWNGFLPSRTLVMGRRRTQSESAPPSHECALPSAEGNLQADLVFVGASASELLVKMIEAMGLKREHVFISELAECQDCNALLLRKLEAMKPKIIVTLGERATQKFQEIRDIRIIPTFHPDELLQNPASKREAWGHLQQAARELGLKIPPKGEKKV